MAQFEDARGAGQVERYEDLPDVFEIKDRHVLRVISHPLRYAALTMLFASPEPLTATQIAEEVGASPSSMSYHLRELGKVGIIHRVEGLRDGRECPWLPNAKRYEIVVSKEPSHEARMKLMDSVLGPLRDRIESLMISRAQSKQQVPHERDPFTMLFTGHLDLTEEESIRMQHDAKELWEKYETMCVGRRPGKYPLHVTYVYSCLPDEKKNDSLPQW